jgi:hypothetical protein
MKRILLFGTLILLITTASLVVAQSGGYDLTWSTIDGGGGDSTGGGYALTGTIGQPDAGAAIGGGGFTLVGGFWGQGGPPEYRVYLPIVIK